MKILTNFLKVFGFLVMASPLLGMELDNREESSFWSNNNAHTLFAPGIFCSEYVVGKYCSEYTASTGELVTCSQALELVDGAHTTSCNFAEIILSEVKDVQSNFGAFKQRFNNFAEGLLAWRFLKPYNITVTGESTNGFTLKPYLINPLTFNIGQDLDIEIYSKQYDECCKRNEHTNMNLVGTSRGASVVEGFIATEYDKKADKRVKTVILEGCFDAVRNVSAFESLMRLLPQYKAYGKSPIDLAEQFVAICNKNKIAVLAVTSDIDTIVPHKNTMRLCDAFALAGLNEFYVLKLKRSGHRDYTCNDGEDMQRYQKVVHAFYKKYDLPHNPLLAFAGQDELERCRYPQ